MPQQSLEQEAMDRVRRMYASFDQARLDQSRSVDPQRNRPRSDHPRKEQPRQEKPQAQKPEDTNVEKESKPESKPDANAVKQPNGLLDLFMQDRDQSLILLLLVLLMRDGADMNLMLALMYLLI